MQIKQGNKIFSCNHNLEISPFSFSLKYLCFKKKKKKKSPNKIQESCVQKNETLCFPLFPPMYIFPFNFLSFPFLFFPISAQATCLSSPLCDNQRTNEPGWGGEKERNMQKQRNTSLPTNFRWHKKNFIADLEYLLYLLFLDKPRIIVWHAVTVL